MLQRQAAEFGARPLVTIDGAHWRHTDAAAAAARRGGALQRQGIGRGDRVAILCGNRIEFLDSFLGCGWIGAVSVPINSAAMGPQIEYYLVNSGARLLIIEDRFVERLATADLAATRLEAIWVIGNADAPGSAGAGGNADAQPGLGRDGAVPASNAGARAGSDASHGPVTLLSFPPPAEPAEAAAVLPGDTLAIMYTSGTTGPAKGVVCPHAQYYWWGANSAHILGLSADDVLCTTLPLFHINALNTYAQAAVTGAHAVFEPRFSASGFWPTMHERGATVVYLLGAMVPILLAQPESAAEREHRVRCGLGPGVPAAAAQTFERRTSVQLLEGYGSTETNFVIATTAATPRHGTMGWVQPGFDARVVDEHDVELPAGEAGELVLRADEPFAFASGYFGMPEKTVEAWRNLWFHTGDRVVREADGALRFVDRIKDAIRRRGENISSYEVEQILLSHPAVAEAAVYPVRSELAEDEVMASLMARPGHALDAAELARYCETRLPYFAIPRYIDVVTELPRTENGKVQKYKLRERGVTAGAWDRQPGGSRRPAGS
ncbi:MAG: ATP-dependent acyl-CoA ligase [Burkholderiales bacterium]|nr:ATP-dependent acyl-CoA ligase [Burkholderiales bacterium]